MTMCEDARCARVAPELATAVDAMASEEGMDADQAVGTLLALGLVVYRAAGRGDRVEVVNGKTAARARVIPGPIPTTEHAGPKAA